MGIRMGHVVYSVTCDLIPLAVLKLVELLVAELQKLRSHVTSYRLRFVTMKVQELTPEGRRLIG